MYQKTIYVGVHYHTHTKNRDTMKTKDINKEEGNADPKPETRSETKLTPNKVIRPKVKGIYSCPACLNLFEEFYQGNIIPSAGYLCINDMVQMNRTIVRE